MLRAGVLSCEVMNKKAFAVIMLFCVFVGACLAADAVNTAEGPEPAPWWMRVEDAQALAVKWLSALTVIAGALAALAMFIIGKVKEIKDRMESQSKRLNEVQGQVHTLAVNAAPPAPLPCAPINPPPPGPVSALLLFAGLSALLLAGCVTNSAGETRYDGKTVRQIGRDALDLWRDWNTLRDQDGKAVKPLHPAP